MDPLEEALRKPNDLNKSSENELKLFTTYNCVLNSVRFNEGKIFFMSQVEPARLSLLI